MQRANGRSKRKEKPINVVLHTLYKKKRDEEEEEHV
jgi:hypothetical protein